MRRQAREPGENGVTLKISNWKLEIGILAVVNPQYSICNARSRGFTYVALLAAIVIIGISLGAAGKYWQNVMMRDREEELLFRGEQYRLAIERYFTAFPGRIQYPQNIDDLLKDGRSAAGKRHLRQKYKDPITNDEFEVIRDMNKGNRITGVYSKSNKEPVRTTGFEGPYKDFEGKKHYNEWKFIFTPQPGPPGQPSSAPPPPR